MVGKKDLLKLLATKANKSIFPKKEVERLSRKITEIKEEKK